MKSLRDSTGVDIAEKVRGIWNESMGKSHGRFLLLGYLHIIGSNGNKTIIEPGLTFDPAFTSVIPLASQAEVYRGMASMLNSLAEQIENGFTIDNIGRTQ
jgi:hypothetical protein